MKLQRRMASPPPPVSSQRLRSLKCSYHCNPVSLWHNFVCVYWTPLWYKWRWHQKFYWKFNVKKDWEHFSRSVSLQSSVSSAKRPVLSKLNLNVKSGCRKGEAQFVLQRHCIFPGLLLKEGIWLDALIKQGRFLLWFCRVYFSGSYPPSFKSVNIKWTKTYKILPKH